MLDKTCMHEIFAVPSHTTQHPKMGRKILHVEFREPIDGERHYYFGSKAAIYQRFSAEQVGKVLLTEKHLYHKG